jgi:hypothetical protein
MIAQDHGCSAAISGPFWADWACDTGCRAICSESRISDPVCHHGLGILDVTIESDGLVEAMNAIPVTTMLLVREELRRRREGHFCGEEVRH